jgi:hypothetical protein
MKGDVCMLVIMRRDVAPLCDLDKRPMRLAVLGDPPGLVMTVYACKPNVCHRIYDNSGGYRDVTPQGISSTHANKRDCPECETALYLASQNENTALQTWQCAQKNCTHSEQIHPDDRFKIYITPIAPPLAQLRAVSIMTNAKWVGAALTWEQLTGYLSQLGQNGRQLAAIRESLSDGTESLLAGIAGELAVTEQQLRKVHMKLDRSKV